MNTRATKLEKLFIVTVYIYSVIKVKREKYIVNEICNKLTDINYTGGVRLLAGTISNVALSLS